MSERSDAAGTSQVDGGRENRSSTHQRAVGEHNERPEVVVAVPDGLEVDGCSHSVLLEVIVQGM
jgi:hypothetical protein